MTSSWRSPVPKTVSWRACVAHPTCGLCKFVYLLPLLTGRTKPVPLYIYISNFNADAFIFLPPSDAKTACYRALQGPPFARRSRSRMIFPPDRRVDWYYQPWLIRVARSAYTLQHGFDLDIHMYIFVCDTGGRKKKTRVAGRLSSLLGVARRDSMIPGMILHLTLHYSCMSRVPRHSVAYLPISMFSWLACVSLSVRCAIL